MHFHWNTMEDGSSLEIKATGNVEISSVKIPSNTKFVITANSISLNKNFTSEKGAYKN